jgi:NhaP-type Na+/H+ or K+/H+ antiporter
VVSLPVAITLFEGGLSLKISELHEVGKVVRNLITIGTCITWILITLIAHITLDLNFSLATLLGAILVVTGPTVIGPLLSHVSPVSRVGSIVK